MEKGSQDIEKEDIRDTIDTEGNGDIEDNAESEDTDDTQEDSADSRHNLQGTMPPQDPQLVSTLPLKSDSSSIISKDSYVFTPSYIPYLTTTIGDLLVNSACGYPNKEAIIVCGQFVRKTYSEYLEDVNTLASGLIHLGLEKGDRIGILAPNCYEWALTQFAAARIGLILVALNCFCETSELEYCLVKTGCKAVVAAVKFKSHDYYKMFCEINPELPKREAGHANNANLPDLKYIIIITSSELGGTYRFEDIMNAVDTSDQKIADMVARNIQFDDPAMILFTSGYTGTPKAVTLSHFNVVNNAYFAGQKCDYHIKDDQRICISVSLYHIFGCVMGTLASVVHGICAVLPSPRFSADGALKAIEDERCTSLYGTPAMLTQIMDHPEFNTFNVSTLFTGIIAGSPCSVELMQRISEELNMTSCTICYGTTETSPAITQTSITDSLQKRVCTVGQPLPHTEVKIVNKEGHIVPVNIQGELLTRGHITMLGYWEDQEKTKEVFTPAGWYYTGDLATMDADGYIRVEGRLKDLVIRDKIIP